SVSSAAGAPLLSCLTTLVAGQFTGDEDQR
ncbi:hypothetical protein AAKU55_004802, partial [Oxalobacteraceae bacterium GrIS 1.11]